MSKLLILLSLFSCNNSSKPYDFKKPIGVDKYYDGLYKMDCNSLRSTGKVTNHLIRCENTEVVCYHRYKTGLQCKFKNQTTNGDINE